jgi:hypothetical protein
MKKRSWVSSPAIYYSTALVVEKQSLEPHRGMGLDHGGSIEETVSFHMTASGLGITENTV